MKKAFDAPGCSFEACSAAEAWCRDRDIAIGSMERGNPRGLAVGPYAIAKWTNLRPHERATLDGTMTGNMRSGPVIIELKGDESDYPVIESEDELDERDTANWRQL